MRNEGRVVPPGWRGMRNMGRVVVDFDLLAEALGLPEGAVLLGVCGSRRFGAIEMKVEHPDLPPVEEGAVIPEVWPTFEDGKLVSWE